jgi:hypothetical protein
MLTAQNHQLVFYYLFMEILVLDQGKPAGQSIYFIHCFMILKKLSCFRKKAKSLHMRVLLYLLFTVTVHTNIYGIIYFDL